MKLGKLNREFGAGAKNNNETERRVK